MMTVEGTKRGQDHLLWNHNFIKILNMKLFDGRKEIAVFGKYQGKVLIRG
jgi:hypothetical protein